MTRVRAAAPRPRAATEHLGAFAIRGQLPGRCCVEARTSAGETSDSSEIVLLEGTVTPAEHLVVAKRRELRGRVTSGDAPKAGAQVFAFTSTTAGLPALPGWDQAATDLDGGFKLALPKNAAEVQLVVLSPGNPLAVWRARLGEQLIALDLRLGNSQGILHLPRIDSNQVSPLFPLLLWEGEPLPGHVIAAWAQAGIGSLPSGDIETVFAMPPGSYRYCDLEPQEALLVLSGAAFPKPTACSDGYLSGGGELTMQAPNR